MTGIVTVLQKYQQKFAALVLTLVVAALGFHTLDGYWRADDSALLSHMLQHRLWDIFFSPAAWQQLTTANLTPWESLSYWLDYALAGLNPLLFYLHQIIALALVAVIAYWLFALFMTRFLALAGVLLFLLGTPVLRISEQLMTRHYLEGLLLSLLVVYCFLSYQRSGNRWQLAAAVLCYLLTVTTKEIYIPVGVLVILLTSGNWAQRVRQALPFAVVIGLYIAWRHFMLPGVIGGYAQNSDYLTLRFWQGVLLAFVRIPAILFGSLTLYIAVPLFVVIAAGTALQRAAWLWTPILAGMVLAPLIPLVAYPGITTADRYLLLPWFMLCFAFAFNAEVLLKQATVLRHKSNVHAAALVIMLVLAVLLLVHRTREQNNDAPYYAAIDTQMRYVWEHDRSESFVPGNGMATSFWMITALGDIKRWRDPAASIPKPVVDDIFVDDTLPLFEYSSACRCMQDISATIGQRLAQFRQSRVAPLALSLSNADGLISWQFGPYTDGSYNVVSSSIGNIRLPVSQQGLRTSIRSGVDFYLRYSSPAGWSTYSPLLHLQPDGAVLNWSRE